MMKQIVVAALQFFLVSNQLLRHLFIIVHVDLNLFHPLHVVTNCELCLELLVENLVKLSGLIEFGTPEDSFREKFAAQSFVYEVFYLEAC